MNLHDVVEWAPAGATVLCGWFLIRFVSEADKFKESTKDEISKLTIIAYEFKASLAVFKSEMKVIAGESQGLIEKARQGLDEVDKKVVYVISDIQELQNKLKEIETFTQKSLGIMKALKEKVFKHDDEFATVKVKLGEHLVMIKDKKKSES